MKTVIITKNDAGQRLDKFLIKYFKTVPASLFYKALRKKDIRVNGKRADGATRLNEGDELTLYLKDALFAEQLSYEPVLFDQVPHRLTVVYEDENILLVDKPAGQIVHDDKSEHVNTTIARIKAYLYRKGEYDPQSEQSFTPALCNRIDRNTAGIVIAAKNAVALREINAAIKARRLHKFYQLLAVGKISPAEGTLTGYLIKDAEKNTVKVYDTPQKGALTAITHYRVLAQYPDHCRAEVELFTGRTHQIRAQFAHMGHPLVGDGKYGKNAVNKKFHRSWQALCAYRLAFDFPAESPLAYLNGRSFEVESVPF